VRKACIDLLGHVRLRRFDLLSFSRHGDLHWDESTPFRQSVRQAVREDQSESLGAGDDPSAGLIPLSTAPCTASSTPTVSTAPDGSPVDLYLRLPSFGEADSRLAHACPFMVRWVIRRIDVASV
jgi:hypothetical protein